MAMNPDCFAPDFQERLQTMMNELRSCKPVRLAMGGEGGVLLVCNDCVCVLH